MKKNTETLLNIRKSLQKSYSVIWDRDNQDRYIAVPKNFLYGAEIYTVDADESKGSICKDIGPAKVSKLQTALSNDTCTYLKIINGSFIRMYYWNDKWNYCTSGQIYASKVTWKSDKSILAKSVGKINTINFFTLFKKGLGNYDYVNSESDKVYKTQLEYLEATLPKDQTHIFIVYNPECINVVPYSDELISVRILSISHKQSGKLEYVNPSYEIKKPTEEDLKDFIDKDNKFSGILLLGKKNRMVFTKNYLKKSNLLSNIPYLKYIILKNLRNKEEFCKEFPFWKDIFEKTECVVKEELSLKILRAYENLFRKKSRKNDRDGRDRMDRYLGICNVIHEHFLNTKESISKDVVYEVLTTKIHHGILASAMVNIRIV